MEYKYHFDAPCSLHDGPLREATLCVWHNGPIVYPCRS